MLTFEVAGGEAVVARFRAMPTAAREALRKSVTRAWLDLQAHVVRSKLSGQVLNRRTGLLANSISVGGPRTATRLEETPARMEAAVGTRVWYGAIHEYGGSVEVRAHQRRVTQVFGRPVAPTVAQVRAHTAIFPERSFLRSALDERRGQIREDIERAVLASVGGRA